MTQGTIERILAEQKEEKERKISSSYCARSEESLVNLSSNLAQVVIGVRRSGKATMCFNLIKNAAVILLMSISMMNDSRILKRKT